MRKAEHNESIELLAVRMSALEERAYEEFSDLFSPKIKGYLVRRGLTITDAEDLTVSCITDIALKVDKYRSIEGAGFSAWVFTIVRHAMIDWIRSQPETLPYIDEIEADAPIEDDPEPNLALISSVREALAGLSETDQTILRLRYFGREHSFSEIGERLDIRAGTVRVQHHRALKRMKSLLEGDARLSKLLRRAGVADYKEFA